MTPSDMLRPVALVITDVSEELSDSFLRSVHRLLVTANVVPSSPIPITLMIEAVSSSEISVLTRATLCTITEDAILHSYRRGKLKSYRGRVLSFLGNAEENHGRPQSEIRIEGVACL
jgi:hypothetical protein